MALAEPELLRILESQGFRELVTAHLFASGVALAPTLDDKHMLADHAREELGHFEVVSVLYDKISGKSLYDVVGSRADRVELPKSWLESAVAGYLVDRAAALQLLDYKALGDARLDILVDEILEHEHEHQTAAETALRDLCRNDPSSSEMAARHVVRWFGVAAGILDRTESARLKKTAAAFVDSIRPTMAECRLPLPDLPATA